MALSVPQALQQLGSQACYFASLTRCESDMAKAMLICKRVNENGQSIVRFAHVRRIDLAGVTREDNLGAFPNTSEDGL